MIGQILSGIILGGFITNKVQQRRNEQELREIQQERERLKARERQERLEIAKKQERLARALSAVQCNVLAKNQTKTKADKQIEFFDMFRAFDNKLARNVKDGFKGVTYLINGLHGKDANEKLKQALKNIRNYRGRLSHDKKKWKDIPAPTEALMNDLKYVINWEKKNSALATKLVFKVKRYLQNKNT